jgi:hypothetical protein
MDWREYQREAARFFCDLGMTAEVERTIAGRLGTPHTIDVLVTFTAFGVEHTWVVECKRWKSRVGKDRVLVLKSIVDDVGADRGFLLTESGFQSGAVTAARLSNITLSNLDDLRTNAEADIQTMRWDDLYARVAASGPRLHELNVVVRRDAHSAMSALKPGISSDDFMFRVATLSMLEHALQAARLRRFPLAYGYADRDGRLLHAQDMSAFLDGAAVLIDELEAWLAAEIAKPWPNRPDPAPGATGPGAATVVLDDAEARKVLDRRRNSGKRA